MGSEEAPGVGLGTELRVRDEKRIGQALRFEGMLAHGSFWMRNGRKSLTAGHRNLIPMIRRGDILRPPLQKEDETRLKEEV